MMLAFRADQFFFHRCFYTRAMDFAERNGLLALFRSLNVLNLSLCECVRVVEDKRTNIPLHCLHPDKFSSFL